MRESHVDRILGQPAEGGGALAADAPLPRSPDDDAEEPSGRRLQATHGALCVLDLARDARASAVVEVGPPDVREAQLAGRAVQQESEGRERRPRSPRRACSSSSSAQPFCADCAGA